MKNFRLVLVAASLFAVAAAVIFIPSGALSQKSSKPVSAAGIPDDVMKIFTNSCMKCHGTGGSGMAMSQVNFSAWDTYPVKKQAKKAGAICYEVQKGSMPPSGFRSANPDKVPTASQIETICKWSNTLNPPKK